MSQAPQDPLQQALTLCSDPFFRDAVWRHCAGVSTSAVAGDLKTVIHPEDQMLLHSLRHHDVNAACSQYYNVALQQYNAARQVLQLLFPGDTSSLRVLDFACGYGRLLRFLSLSHPVENLWASEIQDSALDFVRNSFGVHVLPSFADPAAFKPDRRFHMIWVASLFSHLPGHLFRAWIARLLDCLEPNGVLCFSTHDACLLAPGTPFPDEGILFRPSSENADLDTAIYGTTYVNETYVASTLEAIRGDAVDYFRIPRGLAHEQDIYVVRTSGAPDLAALRSFRRGPWGWVDERRLSQDGELYLRGWAASVDDGALDTVDITVDGQHFPCPAGQERADVARVFADQRLGHCGWQFSHQVTAGQAPVCVEVTARTPRGEMALLYAGKLTRPAVATAEPVAPTPDGWLRRLRRLVSG